MLALTSPSKNQKGKVWTDKQMDGHVERYGQVLLLSNLTHFTTSLSLDWQKYVPFTKRKQPDRFSVQNKTNSTVAVHGKR